MRSLQPEDDPGLCVEAANLQPPVQHQAVHHRPGEALPADVGAPFVWEEAGSPHQLPPNREQPECLNFKPHIPPQHTPPHLLLIMGSLHRISLNVCGFPHPDTC